MINSSKFLEAYLQKRRFTRVISYLKGSVLDFGGNEGELKKYVKGEYTLVNYDHAPMENKSFDTIVALAVIEHIPVNNVYQIFKKFRLNENGVIFLTTPTPMSKPLLEFLAFLRILDKQNIEEHKHYWTRKEIDTLARSCGFKLKDYKKFQLGFNQYAVLEKI
jgi:2-polyprenyl-3-methyl-5-hydroxy-6-metoxy-1,4-benzoquinol methylase